MLSSIARHRLKELEKHRASLPRSSASSHRRGPSDSPNPEPEAVEFRGPVTWLWDEPTDPEILLCGPAGTGKTFAGLTWLHGVLEKYPGSRALLLRKHRASLTESALVTYEEKVLGFGHPIVGKLKRQNRHAYYYPNGSALVVGGCDSPERLFSTEYDVIYVNEAIEAELDEWENLKRANRNGVTPFQLLFGDTNPSHPAHWLLARCNAGLTRLWDTTIEDNPGFWDRERECFTPAGEQYMRTLGGMTGVRKQRLLRGLWAAADEQWFDQWDEKAGHVSPAAEHDPALPVYVSIDPGVYTAAVIWQVRPALRPGERPRVSVLADYLAEGLSPRRNAEAIRELIAEHCGTRALTHRPWVDPAAGARQGNGITLKAEYEAAGLRLESWPLRPVNDGLELIASLLEGFATEDERCLVVHPRCRKLRDAFAGYVRAKKGNQWLDKPADPQHPHEDLMDALRGGLVAKFPDGLGPEPQFHRVHAGRAF